MSTTVASPVPDASFVGANMISPAVPFVDTSGVIAPVNWRFLYQVFNAANRLAVLLSDLTAGVNGMQGQIDANTAAIANIKTGVTDGSDAAAGQIGEYLAASGSHTLATGVALDVTSLTLSPGDWDVDGSSAFSPSLETMQAVQTWLATAAATPSDPGRTAVWGQDTAGVGTMGFTALLAGPLRYSVTAATTVHLGCMADFPSGTTVTGTSWIRARRVR